MKERQVSFAGGELAPTLWGRTDIDRYPVGARTLLNFLVSPHGVLLNRPGTRHLVEAHPGRLVPFIFAEDDVALLLFHVDQVTIYTLDDGQLVEQATVVMPGNYGLHRLSIAQVGNLLYVASPSYSPALLERIDTTTWQASLVNFEGHIWPVWTGRETNGTQVQESPRLQTMHDKNGDSSHPPREWTWQLTRIMRDKRGRLYETLPYTITLIEFSTDLGATEIIGSSIAIYPDWEQRIIWSPWGSGYTACTPDNDGDATTTLDNADVLVKTRVYRGRAGRFGYIGESTDNILVDDGSEPDYFDPPPQGFNPFKVYDADGTLLRTELPQTVAFSDGRIIFAGTSQRPNFAWCSAVEEFENFDEVLPPDDADALTFSLSSGKNESIRALIARQRLIALTSSAGWQIMGADGGEVISPATGVQARPFSEHGCGSLVPLAVNSTIFFMQTKGTVPRAIVLNDQDGLRVVDVSVYSRHLFDGFTEVDESYTIVDWAYSEDPFGIIWVARSDGALLSLTYNPEQQMIAWARHQIAGDGVVESVAVVPDGTEDAVFLLVNRGGDRTIERLTQRLVLSVRDGIFLDASVSYDGFTEFESKTVTVTDAYAGGGAVDTLVALTTSAEATGAWVGRTLQLDQDDGPIRLKLTAWTGAAYDALVLDASAFPASLFDAVQTSEWALCADSVTGLDHLEGQTVKALCDGNVVEDLVVTAGAVALPDPAAIAHVGLAYNSDFESLAAINERGRRKTTSAARLEVEGTRGGYVGPSLDDLKEVPSRDVNDNYGTAALRREEVKVNIPSQWTEQAYVAYRQTAPLPCALLGITRDVAYGGD